MPNEDAVDTVHQTYEWPSASTPSDDWPAQAADTVVRVVDDVKTKTTDRAVLILRAIVYGFVIVVLGVAVIVMATVALLRLTDAYLPIGDGVGSATWAAHGLLGMLLSVLGLGAWLSRTGSMKPVIFAAILDVAILIGIVIYGVLNGAT